MSKVVVFHILGSFVLVKLLVIDNILKEGLGFDGQNVLLVAFFWSPIQLIWLGKTVVFFGISFKIVSRIILRHRTPS